MVSPHIDAAPGSIAQTVLLPGDPLRARHIAQRFLDDAPQVAGLRNMLGYTGSYRGLRVSVIGSGMGIPSCALYATELIRHFGARRLLRVGTCAGVGPDTGLGDILLAHGASTDSRFNRQHFADHDFAATADFALLRAVAEAGRSAAVPLRVGGVFSTDCFYGPDPGLFARLQAHGIAGIDMESAGLYGVAAREGTQALSILTVSDRPQSGEHWSAAQRERGLDTMVQLVLDALVAMPAP